MDDNEEQVADNIPLSAITGISGASYEGEHVPAVLSCGEVRDWFTDPCGQVRGGKTVPLWWLR